MSYVTVNIDRQEFEKCVDETINTLKDNNVLLNQITLHLYREKSNEKFKIEVPTKFLIESYEDLKQSLFENIDKMLLEMEEYKVALDEIVFDLEKDNGDKIILPLIAEFLNFYKTYKQ